MIEQPYGIIYVTGPTGSGKTTTLYSALAEINDPGVNISTAEDPIEYDLPGVTQIQANSAIGLTFASVLRAFLRQDPDVLLVGETRDKETAKTAVEAALTGHLVFTTLHTNSAAVAFTRLARDGRRAVSGLVVDDRRHRAAARAQVVPGVQGADPGGREHRAVLGPAGGHDDFSRQRLQRVRRQRGARPRRRLRSDEGDAAASRDDRLGRAIRRDPRGGASKKG